MRRTTIALSSLALVTTLSACGSQSAGTAQPDSGAQDSVTPVNSISSLVSKTTGSMDEKQTVTMNIDISGGVPGMAEMGKQQCLVNFAETKMSCDGLAPMVMTEKAMYVIPPNGTDPAKPWTKMSFDANGMMGQSMAKMGKVQKYSDLETMLPPGSTITNTAQDQVNGKRATRYEITTDLAKATAEGNELAKKSYQLLTDMGVTELNQTIWVGADQLPLKVESVTPAMTVMGREIPETTTTVTYSDWGDPVSITVPPANKVRETTMPKIPGMPQPPK